MMWDAEKANVFAIVYMITHVAQKRWRRGDHATNTRSSPRKQI
jgi:hypothetical protein